MAGNHDNGGAHVSSFLPCLYPSIHRQPHDGRYEPRRGIVVTASGRIAGQAIGAYVTAYILRRVLGCSLPMEVYFVGPRETFGANLLAKLRELGDVKVREPRVTSTWVWSTLGGRLRSSRPSATSPHSTTQHTPDPRS